MAYDIGVIPGDGIGPEVVSATLPLLADVGEAYGFEADVTTYDYGTDHFERTGRMVPEGDWLSELEDHDALFYGASGDPDEPAVSPAKLIVPIRKGFDQYVNLRPIRLFEGVESPLRGYDGGEIDMAVYRENTEGEYVDVGGRIHEGFDAEVAVQSAVVTRGGTERLVRAGFEAAEERGGHLTSITKSNVQSHNMGLWDEVVEEVSEEYPDVEVRKLLFDAACMHIVAEPETFDVAIASNMFGDVFTDIGAQIMGSMGLAPSGNVNPEGEYPSLFEPVHGTAPGRAGQGIANPLAQVLSGAMMYEHLGEEAAGQAIWDLVAEQLADPDAPRTRDVGGDASTVEVVEDLRDRLAR